MSSSLRPCRLWPARLLCQRGSPGKNAGACGRHWLPYPFLLPQPPTAPSTRCCQNPCDPGGCTTSTPGRHRGKPKPPKAAAGANPSGQPTRRGGSSVQSLSCVQFFSTPWTAAHQASLSITNSQNLLKFLSVESVMPSNHLIFCRPLLLLPSIIPSIRVFSNESVFHIR